MIHRLISAAVVGAVLCAPVGAQVQLGRWDAWLESPGGRLEFTIEFAKHGGNLHAEILNGIEKISVPVESTGADGLVLRFDHYDSAISCTVNPEGTALAGEWKKRRGPDSWARLPFQARPEEPWPWGGCVVGSAVSRVGGRWSVRFTKDESTAVALFYAFIHHTGADRDVVAATFLTPTGDYRYLWGAADDQSNLTVSVFDGAHAFLFKATLQPDGTLKGDFWSGDSWHDTWTAVRDESAALPESMEVFDPPRTPPVALAELKYPDTEGKERSLADPAFAGKARIIEVFGTWCPNCRDATHLLVELDHKYRARGLSILGLAFEVTGDVQRDRKQVKTYIDRHDIEYAVLVAGRSDKKEASQAFPLIERVKAYPTFIFLDAQGRIRAVYTGFSGPATDMTYTQDGKTVQVNEHTRLRGQFTDLIERLLSE